jgi:hypothetical protein
VLVLAAYAVPAAAVWAVLGLALTALPIGTAALLAAVLYGCVYGAAESFGLSRLTAPGRRWQVPQDFMIGAGSRRRALVWGSILGPGFLTRNPYAGFGILLLLVAGAVAGTGTGTGGAAGRLAFGLAAAVLVGAAHGTGRALALLRDVSRPQDDPFVLLLRSLRWRSLDGMALLAVAGAAAVTIAGRLGLT